MSLAQVQNAKAFVMSKGVPQTTNEFPWLVTNLVAFWTDGLLIGKRPEQNGWTYQGRRYSHDAIAYAEGWIDCLISAGPPDNVNGPAWNPTESSSAPLYAPINPAIIWPETPEPVPPPVPIPSPPPNGHIALILARLADAETRLTLLDTQYRGLLRRMGAEEQKPLPDYSGDGQVTFGFWTRRFTVRSRPVP